MEQFIEILKEFSKKDILEIEEKDKQYKALKALKKHIENGELFLKLVVINALLSYQLNTKGEIYWENFSIFFSKNPNINTFPIFLKTYNKRLLTAKLKRLEKILTCISHKKISNYCNDLCKYIEDISLCLKQKKDAKTIVFSAKMLLYGCRILKGCDVFAPYKIFIPIDSRIQKISNEKDFWINIERKTKIPLLHIDSILWITMGMEKKEIEKWRSPLREKLLILKEYLCDIIKEKRG